MNRLPGLLNPNTITVQAAESYAKSSVPTTYHDVSYIAYTGRSLSCTVTPDDCTQDQSALMYQAYNPTKYKSCNLPVVIFFHGGGFADCNGSFQYGAIHDICTEFAQRGFVAISVEYRLGVEVVQSAPGTTTTSPYYTVEQMLAIWRAGQDARGAIRSIVKREANGLELFHIDPNRIFLAGNSAGSVVAMNVAFYTVPGMLASAFPSNISTLGVLGNINQDYYFGETSYTYKIAGVLDLWGGMLLPSPYTLDESASNLNPPEKFFFQTGNIPPPVIAFCGNKDDVFPPTGQLLQFPPSTVYHYQADFISTNVCLNDRLGNTYYSVTPNISYGNILGSQNIYEMLKKKGVYSELYIDCQMKHGLDENCSKCAPGKTPNRLKVCTQCYFSDFGFGTATDVTSTNLYIVQRAATFFQSIMNGKSYIDYTRTKFVECPNNRYSCLDNDTNSNCPLDTNAPAQTCPDQ